MLQGIGLISSMIDNLNKRLDDKDDGDHFQEMLNYVQDLKSIAGFMDSKAFNATTSYLEITKTVNGVYSYLSRLFSDIKRGIGNDAVSFRAVFSLFLPFCYVFFHYSVLYYYESNQFPPNYSDWIKLAERIARDSRFCSRFEYYLRVNTEMPLTKVLKSKRRLLLNYSSVISDMNVYKKIALAYPPEKYFNIEALLQEKIEQKDYIVFDRHLAVSLPPSFSTSSEE